MLDGNYGYEDDVPQGPERCFTCGGPLPVVRPCDDCCSDRCKRIADVAADEAADNRVIEQGY